MLLNLTLTTLNSTLCGLFRPDYPKRILQSRPRHEKGFLEFPHFLHFYAFDISTAYKKVDRENIKVLALNVLLKLFDVEMPLSQHAGKPLHFLFDLMLFFFGTLI